MKRNEKAKFEKRKGDKVVNGRGRKVRQRGEFINKSMHLMLLTPIP